MSPMIVKLDFCAVQAIAEAESSAMAIVLAIFISVKFI